MWIEKYLNLYEKLCLPPVILELVSQKKSIPSGTWNTPPESWGFPPALLPLWSDGSLFAYQGFWKHWFVNRDMTIVELQSENGLFAIEVARDFSQLARLLILYAVTSDDGVSDRIKKFADKCGIDDALEIDRISIELGDFPESLKELSSYSQNLPARLVEKGDVYLGDFPLETTIKLPIENYSLMEFSHAARSELKKMKGIPAWLIEDDQQPVFINCLKKNDICGAWMSLNSNGWEPDALIKSVIELSKISNDALFGELVDAWVTAAEAEFISY